MTDITIEKILFDKYIQEKQQKDTVVRTDLITENGRTMLLNKIQELVRKKPSISEQISVARENGGVEENEEFSMALDELMRLDMEIGRLQQTIEGSHVVPSRKSGAYNKVEFGTTVRVVNADTKKVSEYTIMGEPESDPTNGIISYKSPVGKELMGCERGDSVYIPRGQNYIELQVQDIFVS